MNFLTEKKEVVTAETLKRRTASPSISKMRSVERTNPSSAIDSERE
jgi:hypothetical protein